MSEGRLIWGVSIHQLVCWGTLYSSFPAFVAPMEAEFGWSRAEISGAFTAGLLVAGLTAIPVGRWVDRHGSRGVMVAGAAAGAASGAATSRNKVKGAVIGAAGGGLLGAIIGSRVDVSRRTVPRTAPMF